MIIDWGIDYIFQNIHLKTHHNYSLFAEGKYNGCELVSFKRDSSNH